MIQIKWVIVSPAGFLLDPHAVYPLLGPADHPRRGLLVLLPDARTPLPD